MAIDVSDIVNDPDFAETFTVHRSSGHYVFGGWENTTEDLTLWGVIQPAKPEHLDRVPEGDRVTGAIVVFCTDQIYRTHAGNNAGISDVIHWQDQHYRVEDVKNWSENGYWEAVAIRTGPAKDL
jgi:hypothetical protein